MVFDLNLDLSNAMQKNRGFKLKPIDKSHSVE